MASNWRWIASDVLMEDLPGAGFVLRNRIPLDPYPANVASWLWRHAGRDPGKPFLQQRSPNGAWHGVTYGEALKTVCRISNGLLSLQIDPAAPIAILSENCIDMALLQLAAMQIGQPVVPISHAYSARSHSGSHLKHILAKTASPVLVISDADLHIPKLNRWGLDQMQRFAFTNAPSHKDVAPFSLLVDPSDELRPAGQDRFDAVTQDTLAKIQFTSGSTSLPKGVMISHGMMTSNQVGIAQTWPFLDSHEVFVDWLPWNHTFGGNFVFNMTLMHGGTLYIDGGSPTPGGFETTVRNLVEVSPTGYFGVPRSYTALYSRMKADHLFKKAFFRNLKFIFTAAAALDQGTYEGMKAMSREVLGRTVPFLSAWGATETAPDSTHVYWEIDDVRVIGLPSPGVSVKLAPDPSGKLELRVKGPNVTTGYFQDPMATEIAFDEEGYYRSGDAGRLLDPERPAAGLIFDGRIGEDFKLTSGVWVHNAGLRASVNRLGQPFLLDLVVAAPNREYLTALVYPNVAVLRSHFEDLGHAALDDAGFLASDAVVSLFRDIFRRHNLAEPGSSRRFERFVLLNELPQIDRNETTDKGYINQSAVLRSHAALVEALYSDPPAAGVITV